MNQTENLDDIIADDNLLKNSSQTQTATTEPKENGETFYKMVKYHPSTNSNQISDARRRPYSQPGISRIPRRPRRPQRSMVNMDDMVYDPAQKEFVRNQANPNEPRTLPPLSAIQRFTVSAVNLSPAHSFNEGYEGSVYNTVMSEDRRSLPSTFNYMENAPYNQQPGVNENYYTVGPTSSLKSYKRMNKHHKISVATSMRSLDILSGPVQSTAEEKRKMFRGTLTTILSCMYAVLILTLGTIIYIVDIFTDMPLSEIFGLYLLIVGFLYLLFLLIDIRIYINKAKKFHLKKTEYEDAQEEIFAQSEVISINNFLTSNNPYNRSIPNRNLRPPEPPSHYYCFSEGRHAGSFYLKLGAAGFCLGHLVHSALLLNIEFVYLSDEDCSNISVLILDVVYPIFSFCQLFFIFKYSNVIILKCKGLARFALMHCIGSSLCFWLWTIIKEIMESLRIYAKHSLKKIEEMDKINRSGDSGVNKVDSSALQFLNRDYLDKIINISTLANDNCTTIHNFDGIITNVFPYLFPFTIEYSILIVGIFYILWSNIGNCNKDDGDILQKEDWESYKSSYETEMCKAPTAIDDNGLVSNLTINIDCHSANKGWFGGLIVLVASISSVIVTYVVITDEDLIHFSAFLKDTTELTLNIVMLVSVVLAYSQIRKLDVNLHPISKLDDLLLFICIPAFFMEASFTLVPAIISCNYVMIFNVIIVVFQILVQTPFIIDALRRCSNSRELRRLKPGRELVTFLIVCNVSTWIFETFSVKNSGTDDERYDFYGKILWTILGHISTPLCMFYRFHSSVCLADVWKCAYIPGNRH